MLPDSFMTKDIIKTAFLCIQLTISSLTESHDANFTVAHILRDGSLQWLSAALRDQDLEIRVAAIQISADVATRVDGILALRTLHVPPASQTQELLLMDCLYYWLVDRETWWLVRAAAAQVGHCYILLI